METIKYILLFLLPSATIFVAFRIADLFKKKEDKGKTIRLTRTQRDLIDRRTKK